jgi:hypothetical protein
VGGEVLLGASANPRPDREGRHAEPSPSARWMTKHPQVLPIFSSLSTISTTPTVDQRRVFCSPRERYGLYVILHDGAKRERTLQQNNSS